MRLGQNIAYMTTAGSNLPFIQLSLIGNDPSMIVNVELSPDRNMKMQTRIRINVVENIKK
ncbi:hypothetical protein DERP_002638 [Dermatophagoides pteronyssinus]|uniref:Uncharacterized protein n=1 Tax=Dermatophagoides pteronyssinus TaxID=6956 RepID=A0ABQ8JVD3_DERPT|nr:hypothetical protein DERP_002638 [Dermatophagoides pteronyssinus]